jgi:thiol:disulfide interchange protein DsbD
LLVPTKIEPQPIPGIKFGAIQWPKTATEMVNLDGKGKKPYQVFAGRAIAYVPVQIGPDFPPGKPIELSVLVSYQACNDSTCLFPEDANQALSIPVTSLAEAASRTGAVAKDPDFDAFDSAGFATTAVAAGRGGPARSASGVVKFQAFGLSFTIDPNGVAGMALLLLVAAFGGFLLNFTPCVLPVVPIKIMSLSQAAGNPARCLFLGVVMSLGVVAFWVAIGGAIASISGFTAINTLFQTPWFSLVVGLFILVMAVGMLGVFSVRLPQAVYLINPNHESAPGSFIFGVMTAVLSTPCTAPFMGSAAAWAATRQWSVTLATFGAIGIGMALPYLVLSAAPRLVSRMPRTGPASELIKQVMGMLMVAVAVFFLGTGLDPLFRSPIDPPIRFYWWIVAAFAVMAMGWLVYRTFRITARPRRRTIWTMFGAAFSAVCILVALAFTDRGPIDWIAFTPERLAEKQSAGSVVVLDFTAEWCLNCKTLEATVLHRAEIVKLLHSPGVVPMRVDLTGNNTAGKAKLKSLNWIGIPLLAVYGPAISEPITYDAYTPEMVKDAIAKAAGKPIVSSAAPGNGPGLTSPR